MITLGVDDLPRSIEFYEQGLGFPRLDFPSPTVAFFTLNGTWLGLYSRTALAEEAGVDAGNADGFSGISLAHNVESEEAVDSTLAAAVAGGAVLTKAASKMHWGGYSGYFHDPDHYLWEVAYNPFMWVGPEDTDGN